MAQNWRFVACWAKFFAVEPVKALRWAKFFAVEPVKAPRRANFVAVEHEGARCWANFFAEMSLDGPCWASFSRTGSCGILRGELCCAVGLVTGSFYWQC